MLEIELGEDLVHVKQKKIIISHNSIDEAARMLFELRQLSKY